VVDQDATVGQVWTEITAIHGQMYDGPVPSNEDCLLCSGGAHLHESLTIADVIGNDKVLTLEGIDGYAIGRQLPACGATHRFATCSATERCAHAGLARVLRLTAAFDAAPMPTRLGNLA